MKKIVLGLAVLAIGGVAAFAATQAYFSSTEASAGNAFTSGSLNLKVGINDTAPFDNNNQTPLFSFNNLMPGDEGQGDFRLLSTQDAWACFQANTSGSSALQSNIEFADWIDTNGNGKVDVGDPQEAATLTATPISLLANGDWQPVLDASALFAPLGNPKLQKDTEFNQGYAYCLGKFERDANGKLIVQNGLPVCDGSSVGNNAQGQNLSATVKFYAEQAQNNPNFQCSSLNTSTTKVAQANLATDKAGAGNKWFFYQDSNDTINNSIGSLVADPTAPLGTGDAQVAGSSVKPNLATYQFGGTKLADVQTLKFDVKATGGSDTYLGFNVDFNGSNVWQKRLNYVPGLTAGTNTNPSLAAGSWQTVDTIAGGNGVWETSAASTDNTSFFGNGGYWPTTTDASFDINQKAHTWSEILAAYPNISMLASDPFMGIRVDSGTANLDDFVLGTTGIYGKTQTFDFEN
ncbi:MAG TPA: hypothetical protein VFM02_01925 [Candidatus Paceibacterota bacterium]|nr:hypothetical protein [Candidatus Paceibacterota bacterium]